MKGSDVAGTAADAAHEAGSGFNIHPMDQFKVTNIFSGEQIESIFGISNATLWIVLAVAAVTLLMVTGTNGRALIPGRVQSVAEMLYGFVYNMVESVAGKDAVKYFPYIGTLFFFVCTMNMLGLIPTSFAPTAQFAVTVPLALMVFLSVTAIGFYNNGAGFLKLFWVSSAPTLALKIALAVIELISYFVRPVSHSIRLGGNMLAGHAVLKVFAGFAGGLGAIGWIFPVVAIAAMFALETLVAFVQAYVFTILTCVYLKDALHPGH